MSRIDNSKSVARRDVGMGNHFHLPLETRRPIPPRGCNGRRTLSGSSQLLKSIVQNSGDEAANYGFLRGPRAGDVEPGDRVGTHKFGKVSARGCQILVEVKPWPPIVRREFRGALGAARQDWRERNDLDNRSERI
jgi:hypothetical protein